MFTDCLAEHFNHQIGEAVDDCGLISKSVGGVHHPEDLDDTLDTIERTELSAHIRQKEQAREYLQRAIDLNPHFSLLYSDEAADSLKALNAKRED